MKENRKIHVLKYFHNGINDLRVLHALGMSSKGEKLQGVQTTNSHTVANLTRLHKNFARKISQERTEQDKHGHRRRKY